MNDTKATNRIKADVLRQLMEMSPEPAVTAVEIVAEAIADHDAQLEWEEEEERRREEDHWEDEEAYLREREELFVSEREEEIERMIKASEEARNYLKAIEEFNE